MMKLNVLVMTGLLVLVGCGSSGGGREADLTAWNAEFGPSMVAVSDALDAVVAATDVVLASGDVSGVSGVVSACEDFLTAVVVAQLGDDIPVPEVARGYERALAEYNNAASLCVEGEFGLASSSMGAGSRYLEAATATLERFWSS